VTAALLSNLLVFGTLAYAALLSGLAPGLYQRTVQEDEYLEWATFWLFSSAAWVWARAAGSDRRERSTLPWFLVGLSLFCAFVALEEISWGQRLVGYRPPTVFLESNEQLELNLHNVLPGPLRQAGFQAVTCGYGLLLPVVLLHRRLRPLAVRLGIHAPSLGLAPAFVATAVFYAVYPWSHSGEWAEAMLGAAMLAAAVEQRATGAPSPRWGAATRVVGTFALAWALGLGTSLAWWKLAAGAPERIESARVELEALRRDITGARTRTRTHCGLHKRLHAIAREEAQQHLGRGEFARLVSAGLPPERAAFFLDPWNSPYWIRHACSADRTQRAIYVYSFGPNRRRDSTTWDIVPDDIGAWAIRPEVPERE